VTYGHACLEWLSANPPNLGEARTAAQKVIEDGSRAGAVLSAIRALFKKEVPTKEWLDMNEVIRQLTVFLREEAVANQISIRTNLASDLPRVKADRIQLQQVILNLIVNAMEAMHASTGRLKEVVISSSKESSKNILVMVEDCGVGFGEEIADKIFNPFFTTKPQGIGMGLSISRSIVEAHEGRLWAVPRPSGGAIFQFTLPTGA
jgi:signal transduction histidine kinase